MGKSLIIPQPKIITSCLAIQALTCVLGPARILHSDQFDPAKNKNYSLIIFVSEGLDWGELKDRINECLLYTDKAVVGWIAAGIPVQGLNEMDRLYSENHVRGLTLQNNLIDQVDVQEVIEFGLALKKERDKIQQKNQMEQTDLKKQIETFLYAHNTCSLSTSFKGQPTSRPIEYHYLNGELHFLSEGGEKFAGLLSNGQAAISVFEPYHGFNRLAGMQLTGKASIPIFASDDYQKSIKICGIDLERMKKLPIPLNAIIIHLEKAVYLWSGFKELGFDSRQIYWF